MNTLKLPCTSATIFSEWKLYYIASFDADDGESSVDYAFEEDDAFIQTVAWKVAKWRSIWE